MKKLLIVLGLALLFATGFSQTPTPVEIEEWLVPYESSRPRDPYVDNLGRVWFCGQSGNYIAYFEPDTGEFTRYELDANTNPHNLIVDDDGFVWYAGNRNAHIGKLDPDTGEVVRFDMPDPKATDPHTLVFGTNNDIWFTVQNGNFVGRLEMTTGEVQLIEVPTSNARPYGIKSTPENRPWIVLLGTNKLATVDPNTLELQEISLPRADARPRRLEITNNGNIWYVDYAGGYLGRYTPSTGDFQEWLMPGGTGSRPYGTALDHLGRLWIAATGSQPNLFVGFDPTTESFFYETVVPSGGQVRHMYFHPKTNEIWFGVDTNYLARAEVTE